MKKSTKPASATRNRSRNEWLMDGLTAIGSVTTTRRTTGATAASMTALAITGGTRASRCFNGDSRRRIVVWGCLRQALKVHQSLRRGREEVWRMPPPAQRRHAPFSETRMNGAKRLSFCGALARAPLIGVDKTCDGAVLSRSKCGFPS